MKDFIVKKIGRKPKLKNPVLIEGLPGVGNVARISVDFLVEKLKAKKIYEIYSFYFPNSVFITEEKTLELPKIEIYHKKAGKKDLLFLVGDAQPAEEYPSYSFSQNIVEFAKDLKVKEIITLGGIASKTHSKKLKVHGAFTDKKYKKKLEKIGVDFKRKGSIMLIGAAGLMLYLGKLENIKGFTLLASTSPEPNSLGFEAAKAIVDILKKYFKLKISTKDLNSKMKKRNNKQVPKLKKRLIKKIRKLPQQEEIDDACMGYIG